MNASDHQCWRLSVLVAASAGSRSDSPEVNQ